MTNKKDAGQIGSGVLTFIVLAALLFHFGRYAQTFSYDFAQHFLLADELIKHADVLSGDVPSMASYPTGSHWIAAVVGWIGGASAVVSIGLVTIVSVYISYLLIVRLIGASSPVRVSLFIAGFAALQFTRSLIGWEVVLNFFYSQLVTDVLYFGMLLWLTKTREVWRQVSALLVVCWFAMWIHSLAPLHLLATGCVLLAFRIVMGWSQRTSIRAPVVGLAALIIGAAITALRNPAFREMQRISANDGWLTFGYEYVPVVALLCAAFGAWNLYRCWRERGDDVDTVIGSAVVASVSLLFLQLIVLKLHGDGSAYAVKKHMFIILTLGLMNAVRAIASLLPSTQFEFRPSLIAPVIAGIAAVMALQGFTMPVAPIVRALVFADNAVRFQVPEFKPGDFVADVETLPTMANWMITMGPFQHAYDARSQAWQRGAPMRDGAKYLMLRRTSAIADQCAKYLAASSEYIIVDAACLRSYRLGTSLSFSTGGNGWNYASSGWSGPESWGSWTMNDGGVLNVVLRDPIDKPLKLTVDGMVYASAKHTSQRIDVMVNDMDIGSWDYTREAPIGQRSVEIPESIARSGKLHIVLKPIDPVSPLQLGESEDGRVLGLGVKTITIERASP